MVKKIVLINLVSIIYFLTSITETSASISPLLDKLIEKGYLTASDSQDVRNETQAIITKAEKDKAEEEKEAKKTEEKFKLKIGGYTQMIYVVDPTLGGKEPLIVKRARFSFAKQLTNWVSFKIQPDFAGVAGATGGGNVAFREAFIDLFADKDLAQFRIGQYHQPFGFENSFSSSKKKLADTPQYMGKVLTTDYDYGIQWWGKIDVLSWRLAVINGSGSTTEDNTKKDAAGRIVVALTNELELGTSVYSRYAGTTEKTAMHYGGYLKWETKDLSFPLFFTSEYIAGKDSAGAKDITNVVATTEIKPFSGVISELAPTARYEVYRDGSGEQLDYVTIGVNFYPDKAVRILADYVIKNEKEKAKDDNRVNVMLQVQY